MSQGSAQRYWAEQLGRWAIPEEILAAAPATPWGFPPEMFRAPAEPEASPSRDRALEALPAGGSVLDVGSGGGAAGLALVPPARELIALDSSPAMLELVRQAASDRSGPDKAGGGGSLRVTTIEGRWPGAAGQAPVADVVVCHHVFYNAAGLGPFAVALGRHARARVVVELTSRHPLVGLNRIWEHFHRTPRPEGPTAEDALSVLAEAGLAPSMTTFDRPSRWAGRDRAVIVAFARRRLCLGPEADPDIERMLGEEDLFSTEAACIWWDGRA